MKKLSLFFLILSFNVSAIEYLGTGKYTTKTSSQHCQEVYFSIDITQTKVIIDDGYYDCDRKNGIFLARELNIGQQGKLFENNLEVGKIDGDKITLKNHTPGYELFINKYKGDLVVVESYITNNQMKILSSILQVK